jgi:tetratricopeptide (TPR) repeat protein
MTTKKKTSAGAIKTAVASKAPPARTAIVTAAPPTPYELQLKTWDRAVQLFTQRKFAEACDAFRETARGPAAHIADKARSYLQICERKTSTPDVDFRTAEDHFNYGVERLNSRDIERARFHLGRALGLEPDAEYIVYTMALCCGMAGDAAGACENLKHAIELEPRNRILARQDPEFSALAAQFPALRALLGTDAGNV